MCKPKKTCVDCASDCVEIIAWFCVAYIAWYLIDLSIDLVKLAYSL